MRYVKAPRPVSPFEWENFMNMKSLSREVLISLALGTTLLICSRPSESSPAPPASPTSAAQPMPMPMPMPPATAQPAPMPKPAMAGMKSDAASKTMGMGGKMAPMSMDPFFVTINAPLENHTLMLMALPDFQVARVGNNFYTGMLMAMYGLTPRLTVGVMAEGQKINGLPATYGGMRYNAYYHLFRDDRLLNLTLYGEYEDLNGASLYKMEVSGFGPEDLTDPLAIARQTRVRTFEQRVLLYHDWNRLNATFNFIRETALQAPHDNNYGYALGLFMKPSGMSGSMAGMAGMSAAPALSMSRFGYGVEMIGALGNEQRFGFHWNEQQQYLGPVVTYDVSSHCTVRLEPAFGLSAVSDPLVLRMGVSYMFGPSGSNAAQKAHGHS